MEVEKLYRKPAIKEDEKEKKNQNQQQWLSVWMQPFWQYLPKKFLHSVYYLFIYKVLTTID